jgi:hypothetical protein
VRPALEKLEDRTVPTIVFQPHFGAETVQGTNDGMQNPPVYFIFSGPYWNTAQGQKDEATLLASSKNILSGPYLSGLTEYGASGTASFAGTWNDAGTVPSKPSSGTLQNFLQTSIGNHLNNQPGFHDAQHAPIYVVISDPNSSAQYGGGWNNWGTYYQWQGDLLVPAQIHMIWIGTAMSGSSVYKDAYTLTLAHEMAETISDPTPTASP